MPRPSPQKVDTGSSNLAVAATAQAGVTPYFVTSASSTYTRVGSSVAVQYAVGFWSGTRVTDQVQLAGSGLPRISTDFATISFSSSFFLTQGAYQFQVRPALPARLTIAGHLGHGLPVAGPARR